MWRVVILLSLVGFSQSKVQNIRLVGNGVRPDEGRVEIEYSHPKWGKSWGTICDDQWDLDDANVVCRSLGLPEAVASPTVATYGRGVGRVWLDQVDCDGDENSINECSFSDYQPSNCNHGEDAGVVCGKPPVTSVVLKKWAGVFTSPGYPNRMERAQHEWTFNPPSVYDIVVICFEEMHLQHDPGAGVDSEVYVVDANGKRLPLGQQSGSCVHIMNNPGKVTFYSPVTSQVTGQLRGIKARYAIIEKATNANACKGWDINAKGGDGRLTMSWSPPKDGYQFFVAYNSTPEDIKIATTTSTSVNVEYLDVDTKYSAHVLALPNDENQKWYYCVKNVITSKSRTSLYGGASSNQGYVHVYEDGQWIDVCHDRWWDMTDAAVACRSLGMKGPVSLDKEIQPSSQKTFVANDVASDKGLWFLQCTNNDKSLLDCNVLFRWRRRCSKRAALVCIQEYQ